MCEPVTVSTSTNSAALCTIPSSSHGDNVDPDFDPDFADYYPSSGSKLRTSTFEILPHEEDQVFQDDDEGGDDGSDSDSDAVGLYEDYDDDDDESIEEDEDSSDDEGGDGSADGTEPDDGTGPRTSVKRTMSRRGALAHHGSQYMMGTCDAAVFNQLRRTDGTEEYEKLPAGTQIRYHYYTSPRKRCRVTVEYQDPYDNDGVPPSATAASTASNSPPPPFVDEASDLLESCRLGATEEDRRRGLPRRRTDSFTSNVSCHSLSSSASSASFRLDRSSASLSSRSSSFAASYHHTTNSSNERPLAPHRSADNFLSVSS